MRRLAALVLLLWGGVISVYGFSREELEQRRAELAKKFGDQGFTVLVEAPFVVLGDESPPVVRQRAAQTVQWAVSRLKQEYFAKDPDEIIEIWLFKDKDSYEEHAEKLFHDHPDTPFGYYSANHHALIMNISTGGGTLIHEIVHPFIHSNFPGCPPWFNEGLASLYEQATEDQGHIRGMTNWRLPIIQKAIEAGTVPSFEKMCAMDDDAFYQHDRGSNYGQARYLCYYLQEKSLLTKFFREFVAHSEEDPTGFKTLKKVLGDEDMIAFQKKWEAFVMKLKYR